MRLCVITLAVSDFLQDFHCWVMKTFGTSIRQINLIFSKSTSLPSKSWTFSVTPEVHVKLHGRWRWELVELMDVLSYLCWSRAECSGELSKYELSFCGHLIHPLLPFPLKLSSYNMPICFYSSVSWLVKCPHSFLFFILVLNDYFFTFV